MIELQQVVKDFGPLRALDQITLEVPKGQILGFLGPNGAGKTTALRVLTGFIPPTSGTAKAGGHDVLTESLEARQQIGYLPESTPLYPELKVSQQLHFFGRVQGMSRGYRKERIDTLADWCGLGPILHRPIGQLSKGNRQRVGLAQAMIHDPPILVLDEPTEGLDPRQITEIRKLIVSLANEKTIMLSTHILPEVERSCQRVVIIANGRIVADGTPEELKDRVRATSRVLIEVKAEPQAVEQAFRNLPAVADVSTNMADGWCQAAVTASTRQDIREQLGDVVIENHWPMREMRHEMASLEEFFVQATGSASLQAA